MPECETDLDREAAASDAACAASAQVRAGSGRRPDSPKPSRVSRLAWASRVQADGRCPLRRDLKALHFSTHKSSLIGAIRDTNGLFGDVGKGTLFIDEVAELDAPVQAKLLSVLGCDVFSAVGDTAAQRFEGRLVCATNVDLRIAVRQVRFRADLLDRIAVLEVRMPALCDRPDDVLPLARWLMQVACKQAARAMPHVEAAAIEALQAWRWPGNVRELDGLLKRAIAWADGGAITESLVRKLLPVEAGDAASAHGPAAQGPDRGIDLAAAVARAGSLRKYAELCGVPKSTVHRRLRAGRAAMH